MQEEYEVHSEPHRNGWAVLLAVCLAMLAWGLAIFLFVPAVPEAQRRWDFGALPDVPGESIYSTSTPQPASAPAQLPPLPEADPSPGQTLTGPATRPAEARP